MNHLLIPQIELQLLERRDALRSSLAAVPDSAGDLARLLREVDRALERLPTSDYGHCVVCGGELDDAELQANPLRRYCLCDLTEYGRAGLERDLELAWEVQASLLPPQNLRHAGWLTHYRYRPAGAVSGDYCELIPCRDGDETWLYFLLGDVSGKGVAAAYWMAHLSALVRRSLDSPLPVAELLATVNRHLGERGAATHYVTLAAGRADRQGQVELCNAGHCRPLVLGAAGPYEVDSTNLPLGLADDEAFAAQHFQVDSGDSLLLYSDGITEAENSSAEPYGAARVAQSAQTRAKLEPPQLASECLADLQQFVGETKPHDDVTLLILQFAGS